MTRHLSRRTLLRTGLLCATAGATAGCEAGDTSPNLDNSFIDPAGDQVADAEAARRPGTVRDVALTATAGTVDLGGRQVTTFSYGGVVPGTPIRIKAGEVLSATLTNNLPQPTSVHWHGLALRNDADGVPGVTQPQVPAGGRHTYRFTAAHPGTYWFHPHHGPQLDRGLYAPLIVDDPAEPLAYDEEWTVVLDDWLDGVTGTPDEVLAELRRGMGGMMGGHRMGGDPADGDATDGGQTGGHMMMGASSVLLGGDAGDVRYPYFLVNGRLATAPESRPARPGTRLRIRLINAGGDTAFRVALGGHRMTVTHTDGFPVRPVDTDALLIGMGERYDVLVTLGAGVFPLVALAEGKNASALAVVRTGAGAVPPATVRPRELDGRIVAYRNLHPVEAVRLAPRPPDRRITLKLTGGMMRYDWGFNGQPYDPSRMEPVRAGERVQVDLVNTTTMWHPVHLHGHTFATGDTGVRKDTALVLPGQTLRIAFDADNPGRWMVHCHNIYHAETGMMTLLGYRR